MQLKIIQAWSVLGVTTHTTARYFNIGSFTYERRYVSYETVEFNVSLTKV